MQDRKDTILDAAFGVFAQYGYRRTVMEDIAQAAGLSRTALYQHWRNKDDLFRALATRYFAEAARDMAQALTTATDMEAALRAAFVAKDGKFMQVVLTTPHGPELLEAGYAVTADIAAEGEAQLTRVLSDWLASRHLPADLGETHAVADSIMTALKGLKTTARDMASYSAGQARLARLFARALRPD